MSRPAPIDQRDGQAPASGWSRTFGRARRRARCGQGAGRAAQRGQGVVVRGHSRVHSRKKTIGDRKRQETTRKPVRPATSPDRRTGTNTFCIGRNTGESPTNLGLTSPTGRSGSGRNTCHDGEHRSASTTAASYNRRCRSGCTTVVKPGRCGVIRSSARPGRRT